MAKSKKSIARSKIVTFYDWFTTTACHLYLADPTIIMVVVNITLGGIQPGALASEPIYDGWLTVPLLKWDGSAILFLRKMYVHFAVSFSESQYANKNSRHILK